MDSMGEFILMEKDGKLIYHHLKYHPIPQTQTPEVASFDQSSHPFFLCPYTRRFKNDPKTFSDIFKFYSSPEYVHTEKSFDHHHSVLPLFWCNNKEFDSDECEICNSNFKADYYFCEIYGKKFHKECVESPLIINHPYHPDHYIQLYYIRWSSNNNYMSLCCGKSVYDLVYHCTICQIFMHPVCAMNPISFVIDQTKRHGHHLTFFPRQNSLTCNVCGFLRKLVPTYICLRCNFVTHSDCMNSPLIIKISRHHHRISYVSSLRSGRWFCGVCRQSVDDHYGAYTCEKCSGYVVHSRCALAKDVWDGEELEGISEKDDIKEEVKPFDIIYEGVILHFLHEHHLQLKLNILYNENKFCLTCAFAIYEGDFYSCLKCDFILHETCANAPRKLLQPLHPHLLTFKISSGYNSGHFICNSCDRIGCDFVYQCPIKNCEFDLDVKCALISEPFDYKSHEHLLFLALNSAEKPTCYICKKECKKQLNCIKCNFIVCFKCATLPHKARYKHDKHFLTILSEKDVPENDWCEVCERDLEDTNTKVYYKCNECYTTFHIECLFVEDLYIKPGQCFKIEEMEVNILGITNISRPLCISCKNRCEDKIFKIGSRITCSYKCAVKSRYRFY